MWYLFRQVCGWISIDDPPFILLPSFSSKLHHPMAPKVLTLRMLYYRLSRRIKVKLLIVLALWASRHPEGHRRMKLNCLMLVFYSPIDFLRNMATFILKFGSWACWSASINGLKYDKHLIPIIIYSQNLNNKLIMILTVCVKNFIDCLSWFKIE